MNFYIAEPVTRLPLFNFLVRYIFTEVLKCGKIHIFPDAAFCKNCQDMYYVSTVFGKVLKGLSVEYKGKKYPSFLFRKGRPVPEFRRYLQIEKLFIS